MDQIKRVFNRRLILLTLLAFVFAGILPVGLEAQYRDFSWKATPPEETLTGDLAIRRALVESLYYKYDKWFTIFQHQIDRLEAAPPTLENRMELMKFYFGYAGLLGELSHTLAFTSKFKIQKIEDDFFIYARRCKELAQDILRAPNLTPEQMAQAYMYLGASEGYIGILAYGAGHLIDALINGFSADNHLEKALKLDPSQTDARFGLGMYRYVNSRLGGFGNLLLQGGQDRRLEGLHHLEEVISKRTSSRPLAMKTLAWFYISEQLNPDNQDLPESDPLSPAITRVRAMELMDELEFEYLNNPPDKDFVGNKGVALMKGIQLALNNDFSKAKGEFERVEKISHYMQDKMGFEINPQLLSTVEAAVRFCNLMLMKETTHSPDGIRSACLKIDEQLEFLHGGGSLIDHDAKKIHSELHEFFSDNLHALHRDMNCGSSVLPPG